MKHWSYDSIFYHIYPLGFCAAPQCNDFCSPAAHRLQKIGAWLEHIQQLGANAIYLGPLFESSRHGYDTVDYYHVDRRLGDNDTLARLSRAIHQHGMHLVLDGVFNHVGRDFWAFHDLRQHGEASAYRDWFHNLHFGERSSYGDPFSYEGWNGHHSLVKLNLKNPAVREHLFGAVKRWVEVFEIDGLRLDAADCVDLDFLRELGTFCRSLRADFWLMGEVIHGDYRRLANPQILDSVTNYECYKGLFSSHNDRNYFEIAFALQRQFGDGGLYADLPLYNFADNHDVDRVASSLTNPAHLYPLYSLLFTMPGVPSLYYGSEWGIPGRRTAYDDSPLRPALDLEALRRGNGAPLAEAIGRLARLRLGLPALRYGSYQQVHVSHEQFAFLRQYAGEFVLVALNAASQPVELELQVGALGVARWQDRLNGGDGFEPLDGMLRFQVPAFGARVLVAQR